MTSQVTQSRSFWRPSQFGLKAVGIMETGLIAPYWLLTERLEITKAGNLGAHIGRIARMGQRSRVLASMKQVLGVDGFMQAGGNVLWNEYVGQVGRTIGECIRLAVMEEEDLRALVTLEGTDHLRHAGGSDQETILFISHMGNIASALIALAFSGFKITVARNPLPLRFMEKRIDHTFQMHGVQTILMGRPGKAQSPTLLDPRGMLTTFIDDAVNPEHTSWFKFGNAQFRASLGPGLLAARRRARVLCVTSRRKEGSLHTVTIHPPLSASYTDDYRRDAHDVMKMGMDIVANEVRRSPAEWLNWNYAQIRPANGEENVDPPARAMPERLSEQVFS